MKNQINLEHNGGAVHLAERAEVFPLDEYKCAGNGHCDDETPGEKYISFNDSFKPLNVAFRENRRKFY